MSRARDLADGTFSGAFAADSPTLVVDDTNNRVGAGTASPARTLHVNNNGESFIRITSSDTGNAGLEFGDQSDGVQGAIYQNSTDNSLRFNGYNNSERMRIHSSGLITTPNQPAFNALADPGTTEGTTFQKIGYSNLVAQRGNHYSTSTSRFTAPVDGWYQFNASYTVNSNSDADGAIAIIVNNGYSSTTQWATVMQAQTGGNYSGRAVSGVIALSTNDYVEVWRYSSVSSTSRSNPWAGNFSGYLVG